MTTEEIFILSIFYRQLEILGHINAGGGLGNLIPHGEYWWQVSLAEGRESFTEWACVNTCLNNGREP